MPSTLYSAAFTALSKSQLIFLCKGSLFKRESERSGALVSVISQSRFFRPCERIRNAIEDGRIEPAFGIVNVQAWRDEAYYRSNE